ncbi:MAG TPA: cupin domain-containing protein [bacterium]|nr:cupin domain-containing protein [bacterium]
MPVKKHQDFPPVRVKDGMSRTVMHTDHLMTVVVDFTGGPWEEPDPWHAHPHEQVSYVAEGEILFLCEGEPDAHLGPGDLFAVAPGRKHTIRLLTGKVRLIDSFYPVREDFLGAVPNPDFGKQEGAKA